MRDLYRCLDEYPSELLQAIADTWHIALPKGEPREVASYLAAAMLAPQALEDLLYTLSPGAREALAVFVGEGGALPGHRLAVRYGNIRRLGPARIAREQPWVQPENALEELYYKGIIYRAYGAVGDYYGEVFLVPQQLLERLVELQVAAPALEVRISDAPARSVGDGLALTEDLFAMLVHARQGHLQATKQEQGPRSGMMAPRPSGLGARLSGENHPERLALLWRLLVRLRLVNESRGLLHPTLRAREWLQLTEQRRLQSMVLAWRDDPRWDELHLLGSLRCEQWQDNPVNARRALLQVLADCPQGMWLSLDSFIAALKRRRPDYLRPDGDYSSWDVRDAQNGNALIGFGAWDPIEGEMARHIVAFSLRWLGVTEVGYSDSGLQPTVFRIAERARELLVASATPAQEAGADAECSTFRVAPQPMVLATVNDDFTMTIPLVGSLYERYQLERFSEWQAQDTVATYRITAESIWESQNAGIKIEQILAFLKRISQDQVAPVVARTLQAWGGRFGRVTLRRTVLLQTVDEHTMQQLTSRPEIRALLGRILSPTMCLVDQEKVEELTGRLKALGIWPRIKT